MWETKEERQRRLDRQVTGILKLAKAAERQVGWLIEAQGREGQPIYFTLERGDDFSEWTPDNLLALRFGREIDAANFAASYLDGKETPCRPVEHIWQ